MCSSLGKGAQSTTLEITTQAGKENPHRFLLLVREFLVQHLCHGTTALCRIKSSDFLILGFSFCPSCLQHDQPFPRHVWEWQAPTSTPDCPGLSAADTGLPFGHNSSSHGFFLPGIRALWSELLLQCLRTGPAPPVPGVSTNWAGPGTALNLKGMGAGVGAHPATTLSANTQLQQNYQMLSNASSGQGVVLCPRQGIWDSVASRSPAAHTDFSGWL